MDGRTAEGLTPLGKALQPGVVLQSCLVALVVGTILNVINQGDALMRGQDLNLLKIVLTFIVPFCVSTFGAWSMARAVQASPGIGAMRDPT